MENDHSPSKQERTNASVLFEMPCQKEMKEAKAITVKNEKRAVFPGKDGPF